MKKFFIDGLSGMAQGLFATLIIGTIIQQIGTFVGGTPGALILSLIHILYSDKYYYNIPDNRLHLPDLPAVRTFPWKS